jgi:anti-sigma regulatory factor (Ser/Thr protein kinase)
MAVPRSWRGLDEFSLPSVPGNEKLASEKVAAAVSGLELPDIRIERLKTAVAEATMNAMEHGNHYDPELEVNIVVRVSDRAVSAMHADTVVSVRISDQGSGQIPEFTHPDLEAKLQGTQSPRGWGLFLIKNMVDEMNVIRDGENQVVELIMYLEGSET